MRRILIITYYWPPSAGAGVQRWLKLCKYLPDFDINPIILTVDDSYASYTHYDYSLKSDISTSLEVYKTKSFEPLKLYKKVFNKKDIPAAGFANVRSDNISFKFISFLRSHLFIPDPRIGWNKYAYRMARDIITRNDIDTVISSSPPHSTQLIGLKLKKKLNIKWIADLRDPWTDIYYYKLLRHSKISHYLNRRLEMKVLRYADNILTVSQELASLYAQKINEGQINKFKILYNGFDHQDFQNLPEAQENQVFTFRYIGTMSESYDPEPFFKAVNELYLESNQKLKFTIQLIGIIGQNIRAFLRDLELYKCIEFIPYMDHSRIPHQLVGADSLLLFIPKHKNEKCILTGKLFEYLASGRPIVCLGPTNSELETIIEQCNAGRVFKRSMVKELKEYLKMLLNTKNSRLDFNPSIEVRKFSRYQQAMTLAGYLKEV